MLKKISNLLQKQTFIVIFLSVSIVIITGQSIWTGAKKFEPTGQEYTRYNNYKIFKASFFHLIENKDLYQLHPDEHFDYYKYSPAFALLMAPLAYLPDFLGLSLWNLLNGLVLFFALWKLPSLTAKTRMLMVGFILLELITSLQNSQSNALIAGLIVFALLSLEKKQTALASLFIVSTVFIKLFGIVALALFIFYPNKLRSALYVIGWTLLLAALPLLVVSPSQLLFLYKSWLNLLVNDHSASVGLSVSGWLESWFNTGFSKNSILLSGAALFCLPLLKYKFYKDLNFKLFFLSSILIWIVIFNHKAESPTFIIAVTGVVIWFFFQKRSLLNIVLLALTFIFTVLSATDLFPRGLRQSYVIPYVLKVVPCILVWLKIIYDLMVYKTERSVAADQGY